MRAKKYQRREPRGNYNRTETLLKVARIYVKTDSRNVTDYTRIVESGFWCSSDRGVVTIYRAPLTRCGAVALDGDGKYSLIEDTGASIAGLEWVVGEGLS